MDKIMDIKAQKQKLDEFYENINDTFNNFEQYINKLENENERLKTNLDIASKQNDNDYIQSNNLDSNLHMELDLLKHQNEELNNLLTVTKNRISELSNVLIDKETQIKELKAANNRSKPSLVEVDSDQLFEAKMVINDQNKQLRNLQSKIDAAALIDNSDVIQQKDYEIEILNKKINNLEQENIDLIFENKELQSNISDSNQTNPKDQTHTSTIGLNEIDTLLDEIATAELDGINEEVSTSQIDNMLNQLKEEFEFTQKSELAFRLLYKRGLYRDEFKRELMRENEMIDSFIGEVNGYFEDDYYFELIVDNKNHYCLNSELFE